MTKQQVRLRGFRVAASAVLLATSAFAIGATNNDPWIDSIHRVIPFSAPAGCHTWSLGFLALMAIGSWAASWLAYGVWARDRFARPALSIMVGGFATSAYWMIVIVGELMTTCEAGHA